MTNKQNFETSRYETENPNVIRVVDTYELPRYTGRKSYDCQFVCDDTVENIKDQCVLWVGARDYNNLSNINVDEDELSGDLQKDLELFQRILDDRFGEGEYEAYVLGAYIHSGTSFSISKGGDHRCQFDSGQLGFIGLRKNSNDYFYTVSNKDKVAEDLTAAWNGEFVEYTVTDELTGDVVDEIVSADYHEQNEFEKRCLEQYGVDFDKIEATY